jgi:shikimate dehydrogenase
MSPSLEESPLPIPEILHADLMIFDLVYNPQETRLMRDARRRGAKAVNGLDMLIYQGLASLSLWLSTDVAQIEQSIIISKLREHLTAALGVAV